MNKNIHQIEEALEGLSIYDCFVSEFTDELTEDSDLEYVKENETRDAHELLKKAKFIYKDTKTKYSSLSKDEFDDRLNDLRDIRDVINNMDFSALSDRALATLVTFVTTTASSFSIEGIKSFINKKNPKAAEFFGIDDDEGFNMKKALSRGAIAGVGTSVALNKDVIVRRNKELSDGREIEDLEGYHSFARTISVRLVNGFILKLKKLDRKQNQQRRYDAQKFMKDRKFDKKYNMK